MDISLGIAFIGGLLSFLSPCVLPLVPAYIGYLGGRVTQTVVTQTAGGGQVTAEIPLATRLSTLLHGVAFVAGFTVVFVTLGLATTAFVRLVGGQNVRLVTTLLGRVGGVFLIFLGFQIMELASYLIEKRQQNRRLFDTLFWVVIVVALADLVLTIVVDNALVNVAFLPDLTTLLIVVVTFAIWLFLSGVILDAPLSSSPLSVIIFALLSSRLILWAFVDWLIALPVLAIFFLWLVMSNAFTRPAAFWNGTSERLRTLFYADTRPQMVAQRQQGLGASFFMGVVFSAGWTPCIGPIYGSILTLAATGSDVGGAGAQLLAYSLGLGIPFLLAALLMDGARAILQRLRRYMGTIKLVSGALLIVIGIAVASGRLQDISRDFAAQFTDFSIQLEDCALAVIQEGEPINTFIPCMNETTTIEN